MSRLLIREARTIDAALVHDLTLRAWRGTVAANSSMYDETAETVLAAIAKGGCLVLELEGIAIGSLRHVPVEAALPTWELKRIGVLREHRGAGHGERLIAAAHLKAQQAGVAHLQLGVRDDQPRLVEFYQSLGYRLDPSVRLQARVPRSVGSITLSREVRTP